MKFEKVKHIWYLNFKFQLAAETPFKEIMKAILILPQHKGKQTESSRLGYRYHDCLQGGNFLTLMQLVVLRFDFLLLESLVLSPDSSV